MAFVAHRPCGNKKPFGNSEGLFISTGHQIYRHKRTEMPVFKARENIRVSSLAFSKMGVILMRNVGSSTNDSRFDSPA